ncbi:MAG: toll/interleukin-1 receptor domain-containing protein [Okeania sp. SIO2C9]|uniref:TIR domain-containing protein n=1 Tax=Okeania sp. SIO2C9 TaxID=2607791 RepID=UPI0013C0559C|nr:toll/interleukin-1 receptor domain-containing protein [Okeania sp. SIO2C9]NEQ75435.1 toll/interleukin-1 receptor domain-containing protein [Okeania sp. SIO2C9]
MTEQKEFDVFLSHNSRDKDSVRIIGEKLEKAGIKTWLDEREIVVCDDWKNQLYETLDQAEVVFVFLGTNGVGKWQDEEIEYSHHLYVNSGKKNPRIGPIFLPEASLKDLPSKFNYLTQFHSIRLKSLDDDAGIRELLKRFPKFQKNDNLATEVVVTSDKNADNKTKENNIQVEDRINTMSNSLEKVKETLEPIIQEQYTEADLKKLRKLLNTDNGNIEYLINVIVGYNIVVKVENQGILIRDKIHKKWGEKATKALVEEIQKVKQENTSTPRQNNNTTGNTYGITQTGDVKQNFSNH